MPSGVYARTKPRSEAVRRQISETLKGRSSPMKGRHQTLEARQKIGDANRGKTPYQMTDEIKLKIANSKTKGDKIGYSALHNWVKRYLGTACECENCGFTSDNTYQFDWSNISGEYLKDLSDWARLCKRCHSLIDDYVNKSWATRKKVIQ